MPSSPNESEDGVSEPNEIHEPTIVKYVRPADAEFPPLKVQKGKSNKPKCAHDVAIVDDEARRVFCEACGVDLDPIERLMALAVYGMGLDSRLDVIRNHEMKQREAAARDEILNREAAAKKIVTLRLGDEIWIDTGRSGQRGYFGGFSGEPQCLRLMWPPRPEPVATIPTEEITGCHIYKRAKSQA